MADLYSKEKQLKLMQELSVSKATGYIDLYYIYVYERYNGFLCYLLKRRAFRLKNYVHALCASDLKGTESIWRGRGGGKGCVHFDIAEIYSFSTTGSDIPYLGC